MNAAPRVYFVILREEEIRVEISVRQSRRAADPQACGLLLAPEFSRSPRDGAVGNSPYRLSCWSRGPRPPMRRRPTSSATRKRRILPSVITGSTAPPMACCAVAAAAVRTHARRAQSHPPSPGSAPASILKTVTPMSSPIATAAESPYVRPASPAFATAPIENCPRTARPSTTTSSGASARRRQPIIARPRPSSGWRTWLVNDVEAALAALYEMDRSLPRHAPGTPQHRSSQAQAPAAEFSAPQRDYILACAGCHGVHGVSNPGPGAELARSRRLFSRLAGRPRLSIAPAECRVFDAQR